MFMTGKKQTLDEIFQIIEEELRSQYSIGFVPANGTHDGKFHKLEVKVLMPGLRASARRGYYAPSGSQGSAEKK
jgi:VWFA-related protein